MFRGSRRFARELKADQIRGSELALTLRAMAATRYPSDENFAAQSDPILGRLA